MSAADRLLAAVRVLVAPPPTAIVPVEDAKPRRRDEMPGLWSSPYGVGSSDYDRTAQFVPGAATPLDNETLSALWENDPIAGAVIDAIIDDGMRLPFTVAYSGTDDGDKDLVPAVQALADAVGLVPKVRLAAKQARAFGGAGLVMLANGGRVPASQPLEPDRVTSLDRLIAQDPRRLSIVTWDLDEPASYIWAPAAYSFQSYGSASLHASHVIAFEGMDTALDSRQQTWRGWWKPVLQHVWEAIRDYRQTLQSSVAMMQDGSQGVLSLPGLADAIVRGGYAMLETTLRRIQLYRFSGRIMPLDAGNEREPGEKFEWVERSFAGVADLLKAHIPIVAQAADMPIPRLFKDFSTSGLNDAASGAYKDWYAKVGSWRSAKIDPPTTSIVQMLARVAEARDPDRWGIAWPELEMRSATEQATLEKTTSETDDLRIQQGVPPEAIVRTRYYGQYSTTAPQLTDEEREAFEAHVELEGAAPVESEGEGLGEPTEPKPAEADPAETGERQTAGEVVTPEAVWTGVQMEGMRETVLTVSRRELPREVGVEMLLVSLPITREVAERLMGSVGLTFFAEDPDAAPAPFAKKTKEAAEEEPEGDDAE